MDLLATLDRVGGVARIRDLRRAGVTRYSIEQAIADGRLGRPRPGTVCLPGASPVLVTAVGHHASLACVTAVDHHGVDLVHRPTTIHLTGAASAGPRGAVWHRGTPDGLAVGLVRGLIQMRVEDHWCDATAWSTVARPSRAWSRWTPRCGPVG